MRLLMDVPLTGLAARVAEQADRLRGDAEVFRRHGNERMAFSLTSIADELVSVLTETDSELLSLAEAAEYSGYSADHLSRLAKAGKLTNRGEPYRPRYARGDLPTRTLSRSPSEGSAKQVARRAVEQARAKAS